MNFYTIFLILAGVVGGGRTLYAATCFVPTGGTPGQNHGSIQAAVNNSSCATIRIAPGTYYEGIQISRDVNIIGAGAANTIIDGSQSTAVIVIKSGSVKIDSIAVRGGSFNYKTDIAGGISDTGSGNLDVLNCSITDNYGNGLGFTGGAVRIENSTVSRNNGHGILVNGRAAQITRSTMDHNAAFGVGITDVSTAISESTIAFNYHGGIGLWGNPKISVSSSTMIDNYNGPISGWGQVAIKSSIVANDDAWCGGSCYTLHCDDSVAFTDLGNNISWPSIGNCGGYFVKPNLGPLANNGGLNQTMIPLPGAFAIGTGACSDANGVALAVDQRLFLRPASGCDVGAVESRAGTTYAPTAGWWRLDEGAGTTAHDSSGHAVNGTVHSSGGGPAWYPGAAPTLFDNPYALYSGAYNSWVSAPLATTRTDNVSVSMWLNCGGCSTYGHDFVPFYNGEFRWDGYGLYVPANSRHVELIVNGAVHDFGYTLPMTFTWTHLAMVRANGWWQLYVNGKAVGTTWYWTPHPPVGITSIGADPFGGENFGGVIDDVRVYNRTLSVAEIAWIATGDR